MKSSPKDFRTENIKYNETHEIIMTLEEIYRFFLKADFEPYIGEWVFLSKSRIVSHNKSHDVALNDALAQGYDQREVASFWVPDGECIF